MSHMVLQHASRERVQLSLGYRVCRFKIGIPTHGLRSPLPPLPLLFPTLPPPTLFLSVPSPSQVMHVDTTHYQFLYSFYSWPNVVLSVFGGYLIDRVLGVRWGAILFSSLICLGQVISPPPSLTLLPSPHCTVSPTHTHTHSHTACICVGWFREPVLGDGAGKIHIWV